MTLHLPLQTVTQIVRSNYRTADVFKKHGISYCCGGHLALAEVCRIKGLDLPALTSDLADAAQRLTVPANLPYATWSLSFLIDYLLHVHRFYVQDSLPKLRAGLTGFVANHQKAMPYLADVLSAFTALASVAEEGARREESLIFPYIRQVETAHRRRESYGSLFVRTLGKPVPLSGADSGEVLSALRTLRTLTHDYSFSEKACTTHGVLFQQLKELDGYLVHQHHLQNTHLFPRALQLESELLAVGEHR